MVFILNLWWPDFPPAAEGIWPPCKCAQCDQCGMCRTSQIEDARRHFSITSIIAVGLWIVHYLLKRDFWISSIYCWMDIWTQMDISSIQNVLTWIRTRTCFFFSLSLSLIKMDAPLKTWGNLPWRWGLHFLMWTVLLHFSLPLHSTFLPIFFCSQSSISLDCIWNYRSSYHSLSKGWYVLPCVF